MSSLNRLSFYETRKQTQAGRDSSTADGATLVMLVRQGHVFPAPGGKAKLQITIVHQCGGSVKCPLQSWGSCGQVAAFISPGSIPSFMTFCGQCRDLSLQLLVQQLRLLLGVGRCGHWLVQLPECTYRRFGVEIQPILHCSACSVPGDWDVGFSGGTPYASMQFFALPSLDVALPLEGNRRIQRWEKQN